VLKIANILKYFGLTKQCDKQRLDEALLDPTKVFNSPKEVLDNTEFSKQQKIEILQRWEYDARELAIADDENMAGDDSNDILDQVLAAFEECRNI